MVRDEAHRFAVTFHRTRRNASRLRGELTQIQGIGDKTANKLLQRFGSLERVRGASEEELATVLGPAGARKVHDGVRPKPEPDLE
jgi:excinuclease ABC subunit C